MLGQEPQLRSKRELIEKFIDECMPELEADAAVEEEFADYWTAEREAAFNEFCTTEDLKTDALDALLSRYRFTGKEPLHKDVFGALNFKPKVLERKPIFERIVARLIELVHTFDDNMGDL